MKQRRGNCVEKYNLHLSDLVIPVTPPSRVNVMFPGFASYSAFFFSLRFTLVHMCLS